MTMIRFSRPLLSSFATLVLGSARLPAGDVDFVPYYEPGSSWTTNAAARSAAEGMFAQFEATLKTSGAWNTTIEVWLDDNEFFNYASATAGSFHSVTHHGRTGFAANPWAQIVKGMANPNGVINTTTGVNADLRVSWNFSLSQPQSNIGLLRHELMHGMGMYSNLNAKPTMAVNGTITRPGRGIVTPASIHDLCLVDAVGNPLLNVSGSGMTITDYVVDADWDDANGSGLRILGVKDYAAGILELPLTSYNSSGVRLLANPGYTGGTHTGEMDPVHINLVSYAFAHPTWNTIAEVDRAWFRGVGYSVKSGPTAPQPILSTPAALLLQEDGPTAKVWFTIEDGQSPAENLTVQAVAESAPFTVVTGGAGAVRFVSIQPLANHNGAANVTLRVIDPEGNQAQSTFAVSIAPVNDPPAVGSISEVIVPLGTASASVAFTVQDPDSAAAGLSLSAASSDPGLVPITDLVLGGSGSQRTLLIKPSAAQSGESVITLTISDGALFATRSFRFAVANLGPGDDHADGLVGASTIDTPELVRDGMLSPGDSDVFRFHVPGPGLLIAWTSGGTSTGGALFSNDGAELQRDTATDGTDFRISSRVYAGLHYIEVRGEQPGSGGGYTLHLQFIPADRPLAVSAFARSGDDVLLGFPGNDGSIYQIEWSDDLIRWKHCMTVQGNKRECYERLPGLGTANRRFFRAYEGPVLHPALRFASHHYPFDSNGLDAIGTANFQISNVTYAASSVYFNGLYFGSTAFTALALLPKVDYSAFSFSLHFKPDSLSSSGIPIFVVDSYRSLEIGHQSGKLRVRLNNGSVTNTLSTSVVNAGAWNTVACAVDTRAMTIRLCLNGTTLPSVALAPGFVWNTSPDSTTQVSFTNYGNGTAFKGWADDLRFYGIALTDEELLSIP